MPRADRVYLHHVGNTADQRARFLDAFAEPLAAL